MSRNEKESKRAISRFFLDLVKTCWKRRNAKDRDDITVHAKCLSIALIRRIGIGIKITNGQRDSCNCYDRINNNKWWLPEIPSTLPTTAANLNARRWSSSEIGDSITQVASTSYARDHEFRTVTVLWLSRRRFLHLFCIVFCVHANDIRAWWTMPSSSPHIFTCWIQFMFSFRLERSCLFVVLFVIQSSNKIVDFTVARVIAKRKMKKTNQFEFFVSDFFVVVDMHRVRNMHTNWISFIILLLLVRRNGSDDGNKYRGWKTNGIRIKT